jgi:hypothetical protein
MTFTLRKMAARGEFAGAEAPIGLYADEVFTSVMISREEEAKWGNSVSRMSKKQLCGRILKRRRSAQLGDFLSGHPEVSENYDHGVN